MKWISVNTRKPNLGEQCLCYIVLVRHDKTVLRMQKVLYYLTNARDNRKRMFSEDYSRYSKPAENIGDWGWPVTDWMPLPEAPGKKEGGGRNETKAI